MRILFYNSVSKKCPAQLMMHGTLIALNQTITFNESPSKMMKNTFYLGPSIRGIKLLRCHKMTKIRTPLPMLTLIRFW